MSKEEKKPNYTLRKIMVVIIIIAIIAGIVMLINKGKNKGEDTTTQTTALYAQAEDGTKTNTSRKLVEEKTIDDLRITNVSLTSKDNISYLRANVINTTDEEKGDFNVNLRILDENGAELINLIGYIPAVGAKEMTTLDTAVTTDIAGAYDFEISVFEEPMEE